jgi:ActR/RegA family two-component response regulator
VRPPWVLIAANPYEGELFRRALGDLGLAVELAEGGEGAVEAIAPQPPLVAVVAMGLVEVDTLELVAALRRATPQLPIFLVVDREGPCADEAETRARGVTRLFLRPLEVESLADAVEALAVEAERAPVEVPAARPQPALARIALKPRAPAVIEVNRAVADARSDDEPVDTPLPPPPLDAESTPAFVPRARTEVLGSPPLPLVPPPPSVMPPVAEPQLLRADDALVDAAGMLPALDTGDGFVVTETPAPRPIAAPPPAAPELPPVAPAPPPVGTDGWSQRSTFARRIDHELNAAERRLFPDAAPLKPTRVYEEYDDALGDIDLDSLGIDTLPGMSVERLEASLELRDRREALGPLTTHETDAPTSPLLRLASERAPIDALAAPVDEGGSLAETDLAALLASLHAAGWSGRLVLSSGDGEKAIFCDAGQPVFATSTFLHDRLGDLLYRDGKITREQHARTRALVAEPGRRTAALFVELGMLKSGELFPALRRHVEEIVYSCFAWNDGSYRLAPEQAAPEDRVRLSMHPWAIILEGVRRKYGLERLVELVGPPDTVLTPTTAMERALTHAELTGPERVVAELIDGERSLAELTLSTTGLPGIHLPESALYALAWGLIAVGAARVGVEPRDRLGVRAVSTVVTSAQNGGLDRRARERADGDRPADRGVERERLLAKRAQVGDSDYFAILGVDRAATTYEIRRAYERMRGDFAADRFAEPVRVELREALDEIAEVLDEAYRVLVDDGVRAAYRANLGD